MDKRKPAKKPKKKKPTPTYSVIKCSFCSMQFTNKRDCYRHEATHSDETPFQCTLCSYAGKTKSYLYRHVKAIHERDMTFKCEVCDRNFSSQEKLTNHFRVHTGEKPYKCEVCGKAFSAAYTLSGHRYIHTGAKPFKCSFCPYACRDSSTLRKHQARHMGTEKYYQCKICEKNFDAKSKLKMHIAEIHLNVDVRKFECDACGKRFKCRATIMSHIRSVHERSRQTKCDICGVLLSNRANLPSHMRTHIDERPYACDVRGCKLKFKDSSSLKKHALRHDVSKHLPCEVCQRRFVTKKLLERHMTTHQLKVKKIECDYCGVRFYGKNYLINHIKRKHSRKKKKYICDMCDFVTTNKPSIVMHIKYGHVTSNKVPCTMCENTFKNDNNLKRHYGKAHGIMYKVECKKKPKKPVIIVKQEPKEEENVMNEFIEVIPKIEPLDEGEMLAQDIAATNTENHLEDIPKEVFDEFIHSFERRPNIQIKPPQQKLRVNEKVLARANKAVKNLLERRKRMKAAAALERTRRKYNKLMRKFVLKNIEESKKKKAQNNNVHNANTLLVEDYSISNTENKTTYKTETTMDKVRIIDKEIIGNVAPKNKEIKKTGEANKEDMNTDTEKVINKKTTDSGKVANKGDSMDVNNVELINKETIDTGGVINKDYMGIDNIESLNKVPPKDKQNTDSRQVINNDSMAIDNVEPVQKESTDNIEADKEIIDNTESTEKKTIEENADDSKTANKIDKGKVNLNMHQCYVCFKLFETKEKLLDHCKDHFDLCTIKTLKKCPFCDYATNLSVTKHLKKKHDIDIKIPYGTFKEDNKEGSRYYYDVGDKRIGKVEIIPSIKNLNRRELMKIDKKRRDDREKGINKPKLVKKGDEWIVVTEKLQIKDYMLPKFDKVKDLNVKGGYIERLKVLSRMAKKKGIKMLFPCDSCDKICQTAAALKLHDRKHQANPKPFRPKVWKHKTKQIANKKGPKVNSRKTNKRQAKNGNEMPETSSGNVNNQVVSSNRTAQPGPVQNKHRCRKELIEFYERNIKGGDIEFWQFLKIYNKLSRDNVNDFDELAKTKQFGVYENAEVVTEATNVNISSGNEKFKRVVDKRVGSNYKLLRRKEILRRNEIREKLREKIRNNNINNV